MSETREIAEFEKSLTTPTIGTASIERAMIHQTRGEVGPPADRSKMCEFGLRYLVV